MSKHEGIPTLQSAAKFSRDLVSNVRLLAVFYYVTTLYVFAFYIFASKLSIRSSICKVSCGRVLLCTISVLKHD